MAILHHPQSTDFQRTAGQFYKDSIQPKVYDREDHQNFAAWYLSRLHKQLTKSEMDRTRENFTYDLDYYFQMPNPSKTIEIF